MRATVSGTVLVLSMRGDMLPFSGPISPLTAFGWPSIRHGVPPEPSTSFCYP